MRLLWIGIVAAGAGVVLFACSSKSGFSEDPVVDGGPVVEASLPAEHDASVDEDAADATDDYVVPDASVTCGTGPCAVSLSGWGNTLCALLADGTVACWGSNDQAQLGYDTGPDFPHASATANRVPDLSGVAQVSVGEANTCARVADGGVLCWGAPDLLNAGTSRDGGDAPFSAPAFTPTRLDLVEPASSVAVGSNVACSTDAAGKVRCWGQNGHLELGRGAPKGEPGPPGDVALGARIAVVEPGVERVFALTAAGDLWSWGASTQQGGYGFLLARDTSEDPDGVPAKVPFGVVRGVGSGPNHGCAVVGRYVTCWGANDNGQLGRGTFGPEFYSPAPTNLEFVIHGEDVDAGTPGRGDVTIDLSVSDGHSCAVMASGRVYCWGGNFGSKLGDGVPADVQRTGRPTRIVGLSGPAVRVVSTASATCALLQTGNIECWGTNFVGQLGRGARDDQTHPHPVNVVLPP
ncbi:hypothetical protein [Labilithrix luteola]